MVERGVPAKQYIKLAGAEGMNHKSAGERLRSRGVQSGIMKRWRGAVDFDVINNCYEADSRTLPCKFTIKTVSKSDNGNYGESESPAKQRRYNYSGQN